MQTFNSVGREEHGKKLRYYTSKRSGNILELVGKRISIDGKVRKVLAAEEWVTSEGESLFRYRFWVWK